MRGQRRGAARHRWAAAGVLLCLLFAPLLHAASMEIFVVGDGGPVHTRIIEATRAELAARGAEATLHEVDADELEAALEASGHPGLVVTLGTRAAQSLTGTLPVPVLHAAIAATLYPELLASSEPEHHPHGHSAQFLDQPAARQIANLRLAIPHLQRLGILASSGREALIEPLARAARDADIEIVDAVVPEEGLLIPRVEQMLRHADALLITPDPALYNRYTLQKVLLAAYRQRKPVIGLSATYVKAGALLALHTDPEAVGGDLGETLARFIVDGRLPPPGHARRYAVAVNHHVARSLGLNLPTERELLEALRRHEARP